jgi:hypothetical protein
MEKDSEETSEKNFKVPQRFLITVELVYFRPSVRMVSFVRSFEILVRG